MEKALANSLSLSPSLVTLLQASLFFRVLGHVLAKLR